MGPGWCGCGRLGRHAVDFCATFIPTGRSRMSIKTVTVFCGSSDGVDPQYADAARGEVQVH